MFPQQRQVGLAAAAQLDQTTGQTNVYFSKFIDDDCKVFYSNNNNRYKTFGALKGNTDFELFFYKPTSLYRHCELLFRMQHACKTLMNSFKVQV